VSISGNPRNIPDELVDEVRAKNDIVSVVEQYVRLDKRSGSNFFGLCPFHNEDTPSFSVSPQKQIFYCFGCHKGGNVITFIREIEKCTWPQALKILADRANVKLPEPEDDSYRERAALNSQIAAIYLEAARYYYRNLIAEPGKGAHQYLRNRAISDKTLKKFGLGYATDDWDGLYRHLTQLGLKDSQALEKSGLFKRGKQGGIFDLFRNRLMFPIFDAMGKIVAFGGRVLDDSLPKYINSPETPLYTKGRHLYGLNIAKSSHDKRLVLVEGYMDALAMHQAGIDNTVAVLGTALTESQAHLIRKYTDQVIVGFDADRAGQTAALRSLDILTSRGLKVTVLQIPDGKDPDEFIRKQGPERFRALLEESLPLLDYKLEVARQGSTQQGHLDILAYQDQACTILAREDNAIIRELYAGKVSEILHASPDSVNREIERRRLSEHPSSGSTDQLHLQLAVRQQVETETDQPSAPDSATREEIYLLSMLAENPSVFCQMEEPPQTVDFSPGAMQVVATRTLASLSCGHAFDVSNLMIFAESFQVHGRMLSDLLAKASMKLDETFAGQDPHQTARELLRAMRLERLRQDLKATALLAEDQTHPEQAAEARSRLVLLNQQIQKMRAR
jgi:DNA primase